MKRLSKTIFHCVILLISTFFLGWPLGKTVAYINDPHLLDDRPPAIAFDLHRAITDDFTLWARARVHDKAAESLSLNNISGTEWPMFSAVYFLWATEELVASEQTTPEIRSNYYALDAIEAAVELVASPSTAAWVQRHWGDDYLTKENLFYRMLLIAGLTSYQTMTGNQRYEPLLKSQVLGLARELDDFPHGLLDDYPGQCYPIDIVPAVAVINRASKLLKLDLSDVVERSIRGFIDDKVDKQTGLPAYVADSVTGQGIGPARGVGVSYMLIWSTEIWPELSQTWYQNYTEHFVESSDWLVGVREYPQQYGNQSWLGDVDSGPIVWGKGVAASAFGLAAARVQADHSLTFGLSAQAIVAAWPLPNNRLLVPQLLSDLTDAPLLGESAMLFILTRPIGSVPQPEFNGTVPRVVIITLIVLAIVFLTVFQYSARRLIKLFSSVNE